ncbi:MAG: hypothetical protein U1D26_00680 [Patescibacteria group bacterium]|nr:hypothetical protein [Patescibacteria group bacterium]
MTQVGIANWALRIGVAFALLYPPIDAIFNPYSWIGYFPHFIRGIVPDLVLLHAFGLVEVFIALWILSGWRIFWPSLVAGAMLIAIVAFNAADIGVIFRDLSIAAMALALAVVSYHDESGRIPRES